MILDTNTSSVRHLDAFKRAGVTDIGRYMADGLVHEDKVIKPAEAHAIADAGMRLFLIYEKNGRPSGAGTGSRDGEFALAWAKTLGAPKGAVIYYTVDHDASLAEMPGIIEAFDAFKRALGGYYQVGAYASGYVCNELYRRGLVNFRWLTMSMGFRGSRDAMLKGEFELRQEINRHVAGLDVDPDATHVANGHFGSFVPFAVPSQDAPPASATAHTGSVTEASDDSVEYPLLAKVLGALAGFCSKFMPINR